MRHPWDAHWSIHLPHPWFPQMKSAGCKCNLVSIFRNRCRWKEGGYVHVGEVMPDWSTVKLIHNDNLFFRAFVAWPWLMEEHFEVFYFVNKQQTCVNVTGRIFRGRPLLRVATILRVHCMPQIAISNYTCKYNVQHIGGGGGYQFVYFGVICLIGFRFPLNIPTVL